MSARRLGRTVLMAAVAILGPVSAAAAQAEPELDVRIEQDLRPRTSIVADLTASYRVTVTDRATGQPPAGTHVVSARAVNDLGEESIVYACGHTNDVDSRTPPGIYDCSVIVDHGGAWTFVAVVSRHRDDGQPPLPVAEASVPFELATQQAVAGDLPSDEVDSSPGEVAWLLGHSALAAGWFVCVGLLALRALPGLRRRLSPLGGYLIDRRLDLIVRATWFTTAAVVVSGLYLILRQAAYDLPTPSEVDAVFDLPYAQPYLLTLVTKILLYVLMASGAIPLVREARRQALSTRDAPVFVESVELDPLPVGGRPGPTGGVAVAAPKAESLAAQAAVRADRAPAPARLAAVGLVAGGVGIWVCVTLLKYFHELVEATGAL
jgi:hypothetical protein